VTARPKIRGNDQQLEVLWTTGTLTGLTDVQLLRRFAQTRDPAGELAFRELVQRHGPMVHAVCRQILRHSHDVDDAFQATFLVLVRKARSIRLQQSLAPWLCSVAYRTAHRARAASLRHRSAGAEQVHDSEDTREGADAFTIDLRPLLHEELGRLPDRYRAPIVLCHLEGKTHEQAARLLNWPVGTLSGRLSRGRQLLRSRLQRRGVCAPIAIFTAPWHTASQSGLTAPLAESTYQTAIRFVASQSLPTSVLSLTQGVLKMMLFRKLGTVAAVLLVGAISGGAIVVAHRTPSPAQRHSSPRDFAPVSSQEREIAPNHEPAAGPGATSQGGDGSEAVLTDGTSCDGPQCPLADSGNLPPYCPISMAFNVVSRMIGQVHDWSSSR
jgi:RNA polymerase sigma factor (sigma-70 family)